MMYYTYTSNVNFTDQVEPPFHWPSARIEVEVKSYKSLQNGTFSDAYDRISTTMLSSERNGKHQHKTAVKNTYRYSYLKTHSVLSNYTVFFVLIRG